MNCRSRSTPSSRQRGLTLVELLVAIVILGFVMTLVSETVFQVSQVARAAQTATATLSRQWASGWSVQALFANLVAPAEPAERSPMEGTATRLTGYSTSALGDTPGVAPFELELRDGEEGSSATVMVWRDPADERSDRVEVVAGFDARVEFAYVDAAGQVSAVWPPTTRRADDEEDLPRAVIVRERDGGRALRWYPFLGEPARQKKPSRPFWETN